MWDGGRGRQRPYTAGDRGGGLVGRGWYGRSGLGGVWVHRLDLRERDGNARLDGCAGDKRGPESEQGAWVGTDGSARDGHARWPGEAERQRAADGGFECIGVAGREHDAQDELDGVIWQRGERAVETIQAEVLILDAGDWKALPGSGQHAFELLFFAPDSRPAKGEDQLAAVALKPGEVDFEGGRAWMAGDTRDGHTVRARVFQTERRDVGDDIGREVGAGVVHLVEELLFDGFH